MRSSQRTSHWPASHADDLRSTLSRRDFLRCAAAGAAGTVVANRVLATPTDGILIDQPADGAVLHGRHGVPVPGGLRIQVVGRAPAGQAVQVNGSAARREGERFAANVVLSDHENKILATTEDAGRAQVRVVWDRHSYPRYRVAIDDNSFFLRDIVQHDYKSLFDCFYLKMLRDLHDKYGARFVLNIYYTTGDDFNLTQFPDRYRGEWQDNADWLKLAFHAHADQPARPYQDAPPEQLAKDFDKVSEQIVRFAGEPRG